MNKKIILSFCMVLLAQCLLAAYIERYPIVLKQPDGKSITCYLSGDEFHNWVHDADHYTIVQDERTGYYVYAMKANGVMHASSYKVGECEPKSVPILQPYVNISESEYQTKRLQASDRQPLPLVERRRNIGTVNNIVVFVRFKDDPEFSESLEFYQNMHNSTQVRANSLKNYYHEISKDQLTVESHFFPQSANHTIVSYCDSLERRYYESYSTNNPDGYTNAGRMDRENGLINRALDAIATMIPADLNIDFNQDSILDNICFIIHGDLGLWATLLWPHMGNFSTHGRALNGKKVATYNFQIQESLKVNGTGMLAHEFFHSLGAPDFYHYSQTTAYLPAVDVWDVMAKNLNPPQHPSAYTKYYYGGWIDSLPEISRAGSYTLGTHSQTSRSYFAKIASELSDEEFFLVEYRKRQGTFDSSLPGSGLLIYRIHTKFAGQGNKDYDPNNGVYDELYVFRPGGQALSMGEILKANFSAESGRTMFNATTEARCLFSNDSEGDLQIHSVSNCQDTMTFTLSKSYIRFVNDTVKLSCRIHDSLKVDLDSDLSSFTINYTSNSWLQVRFDSIHKALILHCKQENTLSRQRSMQVQINAFGVSSRRLTVIQEKYSPPNSNQEKQTAERFDILLNKDGQVQVRVLDPHWIGSLVRVINNQGQVCGTFSLVASDQTFTLPRSVRGLVLVQILDSHSLDHYTEKLIIP